MHKKITKIVSAFLCFLLIFYQSGFVAAGGTPADPMRPGAQIAAQLDISSHLAQLRSGFVQDKFRPLHLRYLEYDPHKEGLRLLLDKGDFANPQTRELETTTKQLLRYFFIGLTLPNDSFWVNLRPDAPDNIIDPALAQTDVGRILLEADLQLKKDTALFTSPQTPEGKEYWNKLYKKAEELFGYDAVTIPTLTRPWIVPDEIIVREAQDNAYIYKATLKVMLEQDYLSGEGRVVRGEGSQGRGGLNLPYQATDHSFSDSRLKVLNEYSSQLIRELIIPKITRDVNSAKRYAPLRQVYYSLILAQWFKSLDSLRSVGAGNDYAKLIDSRNLT